MKLQFLCLLFLNLMIQSCIQKVDGPKNTQINTSKITDSNTTALIPSEYILNAGANAGTVYAGKNFIGEGSYPSTYYNLSNVHVDTRVSASPLFQSTRWAKNLLYSIPVSNGTYSITYYHKESWFGFGGGAASAGQRVIDIMIENKMVFANFDNYVYNKNQETALTFKDIQVLDGTLNLGLFGKIQNASISGLEIVKNLSTLASPSFNLTAPSGSTISLALQAVSNATSYDISIAEASTPGTIVQKTTISGLNYNFSGLKPGTKYRVGASATAGSHNPSPISFNEITTSLLKLSTPLVSNVSATASSVSLGISAVSLATSYTVFLDEKISSVFTQVQTKTISTQTTSFANLKAGTDYRLRVTALANGYQTSDAGIKEFRTLAILATPFFALHLNAGAATDSEYKNVAFKGENSQNAFYSASTAHVSTSASPNLMLQTTRWAKTLNYKVPVPNGSYTVKFYHKEPWFGLGGGAAKAGQRVFDISIEGKLVKDNFDNFVHNQNLETELIFAGISVLDGFLDLSLIASVDNASISGLTIVGSGPQPQPNPQLAQTNFSTSSATGTSVSATLSVVTNATSYEVLLDEKINNVYTQVQTKTQTTTSFSFSGLKYSTDYRLRARALASGYTASDVAIKELKTLAVVVATPAIAVHLNTGGMSDSSYNSVTFKGESSLNSYFSSSSSFTSNSSTNVMFQSTRYAKTLNYRVPVANGTYTVKYYHKEPWFGLGGGAAKAGQRVFDISIEGKLVKDNFDNFVHNQNLETELIFAGISVLDGFLDLSLIASVDNASISGLTIVGSGPQPQLQPNPQLAMTSISTLTSTDTSAVINFTTVLNATSFNVTLLEKISGTFTQIDTRSIAVTSVNYTGLKPSTEYQVRAVAKGAGYLDSEALTRDFKTNTSPENIPGDVAGTTIETFGGNPFYSGTKFYGNLTITPTSGNRSRVTYNGQDAPFTAEYSGKEFVAYRIHKNSEAYPTSANYYPKSLSSRYSKVVSVVDGKNLEVDFAYNGGDINSPKTSINASGYFFFNNQQAFINAFSTSNRTDNIILKAGKVYVTKGGWSVAPSRTLNVLSTRTDANSGIKFSHEDFFRSIGDNTTFNNDYRFGDYFKLTNNNLSIRFNNVDLLPSLYTISSNVVGVTGTFFNHIYSGDNNCKVVRELSVTNSKSLKEIDEVKAKALQIPAGYFSNMPSFGYSMCGGQDDGTDVTHYQEFKLINTDWVGVDVFNMKNAHYRAGNFLHVKGSTPENKSRVMSDRSAAFEQKNLQLRFEKDEFGHYRIVRILNSDVSAYTIANPYWYAYNNSSSTPTWFNIPEGGIAFGKHGDHDKLEGLANPSRLLILDPSRLRVSDAIPELGKTYSAAFAPTANVLRVHGLALFKGDVISVGGQSLTITNVVRGHDSTYENYADLTLNGTINQSFLNFVVISNAGQRFLTSGGSAAKFSYIQTPWGYLGYINQKLNVIFENVLTQGHLRATSHMDNPSEDLQLFKQAKYIVFKNTEWTDLDAFNQMSHSRDLMNRSKITGISHKAVIDNSRMYWARPGPETNEVEFRNRPRLTYGTSSYGGPRFVGGIYQDGQGFVLEDSEFHFEAIDGKEWDLRNMTLDNNIQTGSFSIFVNGNGSINFSGLSRINKTKTTNNGLQSILITRLPWSIKQAGILNIYANGGESAVGVTGAIDKPLNSYRIDLRNWYNAPGVNCSWNNGICFPGGWVNDPLYPQYIKIQSN